MPNFSNSESAVISLFPKDAEFSFRGKKYVVIRCCKPRPSTGECKTDVFLELLEKGTHNVIVYKISVKQDNADFLENKISYERAKEIFGNNVSAIISESISQIRKSFEDDYLVYFKSHGKTEDKTIKIGWKFELMNKISGEKSALLQLTDEQKLDVYSGINLSDDKKNSYVGNEVVVNSGVAEYLLVVSDTNNLTVEKCLGSLIPLESYVKDINIYFACKAINYRVNKDKWDGDRPLSVWVDWKLKNGKLDGELNLEQPLAKRANEIGENIRSLLKTLKIDAKNFGRLKEKLSKGVRYY